MRVVAVNREPDKWRLDQALAASRPWRLAAYPAGKWAAWLTSGLRQRLAGKLVGARVHAAREHACSRYFPELARLATAERAELYIAHTLPALPAAAAAAHKWKARLGFDAEDFHRGELDGKNTFTVDLTKAVEQRYIPSCDYVTAASDGIGGEYAAVLGIKDPITILNVFPRSEQSGHTPRPELEEERKGDGLSLYWYSQVIGPGRGLEDALRATALLDPHVRLHLRGGWARGYREAFENKVNRLGIADRVHVLAPVPPEQLIERAAQHDVGLALETGETRNRQLAVTNKLFAYMLAGLAIAATDVPGQAAILRDATGAGFTYSFGRADVLAARLQEWINYPSELAHAKNQSRLWGERRYCWELESPKLLELVRQTLS